MFKNKSQNIFKVIFRNVIASRNTDHLKDVTHCIFDMDGTLLDSEAMHHDVIREELKKYGLDYPSTLELQLHGKTDRYIVNTLIEYHKMQVPFEELQDRIKQSYIKELPSVPFQKGAKRLLHHLHECRVPMALATNSPRKTVEMVAKMHPEFALFRHFATVSDVPPGQGKPHPRIYLLAAERFNPKAQPKNCLVFEDSTAGVTAGLAAGMQVVAIPVCHDIQFPRKAFIIESLLQFKPEIYGLPPFDQTEDPRERGDD